MSGVVEFDLAKFRRLYPKIMLEDEQLEQNFLKAEMLLNNTPKSCVTKIKEREMLLLLLVAHISMLQQRVEDGNTATGRIASASEGSVSVSFDYGTLANNEKWFVQTPFGAEYWQLTAKYRSVRYTMTRFPMRVRR
ncbi:DUF4054 domain-containing protein [Acinetobacter sp. V91_7]|uniref:DUF4054 domain-containing protein n=1 Tax=unclassified Acinetobacter TaxID=196816 RepID=UPI00287C7458|nr:MULTISPECIES: DUF4054 domain-containing protein [unclassified Acinetobacter]MDS7935663.1 DUF4054 domain-containing protein [Acinetobacter sp. V91_4B]MDS7964729.1 DUF4054 domain-containing protein [Acinetobacter sp. V91_7]MDS8025576.1 DUF4054 domain-containing protein [Acinetobacter sp. V91_13]